MAKYIKNSQDKLNSTIHERIQERMQEPLESSFHELQRENKETSKEQLDTPSSGKNREKEIVKTTVRIPKAMYHEIVENAIVGHDNNFNTYIKDLIVEDYWRNKDYYQECVERRKKMKY